MVNLKSLLAEPKTGIDGDVSQRDANASQVDRSPRAVPSIEPARRAIRSFRDRDRDRDGIEGNGRDEDRTALAEESIAWSSEPTNGY